MQRALLVIGTFIITFNVNAIQPTVFFKAKVDSSETSVVKAGEVINGSFTYEQSTQLNGGSGYWYFDNSLGSNITLNLPNGVILKTFDNVDNKVDIHGKVRGNIFSTTLRSNSNSITNNLMAGMIELSFDEYGDFSFDSKLRDSWFSVKEFNSSKLTTHINNSKVTASIIEISNSLPARNIITDAYSDNNTISENGGRLYFVRDITNTSNNEIEIRRWEYVTLPDGTIYNKDRPIKVTLSPQQKDVQNSAYYTVPEYWPSGAYTYHLNSMEIPGGQVSHISFSFNKE